jgi:hypothetical protein
MTEPAAASEHGHAQRSPISVPWVIAAALLIGAGIWVLSYMLLEFDGFYLIGIAPVVLGSLMLFDKRAGLDHA